MVFNEPMIEFVKIDAEDVLKTSGGASIDVCAPGSTNDPDVCFAPGYPD